ncbi:MAG: hypothetical protein SNJ52_00215, partial [Verrucomicrobiia bacterium]
MNLAKAGSEKADRDDEVWEQKSHASIEYPNQLWLQPGAERSNLTTVAMPNEQLLLALLHFVA